MATEIIIPAPEKIEEDIQQLKEWMSKEPHLPKVDDIQWLKRFLYQNKFSLEKTKFKLECHYSLKTKYPELLKNRDPTSAEMRECRKYVKLAVSDKLLENQNTSLLYIKFVGDLSKFDPNVFGKRLYMVLDLILLKGGNRTTDAISILDFQDFRYLQALKLIASVHKFAEISSNYCVDRPQAVHIVNFPSFAHKFLEISQQWYPKKVKQRTHVHSASKSTLLEMVAKEAVCSDYGGSGLSLTELEEQTQEELEKHRKWFEKQETLCSDESLRRRDFNQLEEMRGSFRKLEID